MTKNLPLSTVVLRHRRFIHLMLAILLILGLGITESQAATTSNTNKPILTKSGKKAALQQAADAILQQKSTLTTTTNTTTSGPPKAAANFLAAPATATDPTKVPHYFGPFPNYANSPLTLPNVVVAITGDGTGATATASIGANGAITGVTITSPGSGYTTAGIAFGSNTGSGATADAVINTSGVVSAINVGAGGTGYTAPVVNIAADGGATINATAIAYGGVENNITVVTPGSGYQNPTMEFDLPDGPDGVKAVGHVTWNASGQITGIVVDQPGSGYSFAPNFVIRDGTTSDPIPSGGLGATGSKATLYIQTVAMETFGADYTSAPTVTITDSGTGTGSGAVATAVTDIGTIIGANITNAGSGYLTAGGMKKFQDGLPMLCDPSIAFPNPGNCTDAENNLGQHLPLAVPDTTAFTGLQGPAADYYVIALVQHKEQMHSDLPPTLQREYVQLASPGVPGTVALMTDFQNKPSVPTLMPDGSQAMAVDQPHFLGPVIAATKDRPVRIVFYNLLPTGSDGDLYIPTDSTIMGSGYGPPLDGIAPADPLDQGTVMDEVRNPVCNEFPKNDACFKDNRATLHLHGGTTPWISDGTPHQWITPANETTPWPEGVSVGNVPDMSAVAGIPDCSAEKDGCQTFYYTNQQSARLLFYHDHAWGITRLNVYAGEAAGYLITDDTDKKLIADGIIPADQIPLIIQDRTFVPSAAQLAWQDPTWDSARWGGLGSLWYEHVYMPAQNPGDTSGASAFGRWMYGPWFWPPATPPYGPIDNPYYTGTCDPAVPSTWDWQTDPFCEPALIPGTPNISTGMEQFNDTPIVNGTAYPTTTLEPKAYRFRILNAANDRFFNLQWYVADPGSEADPAIGPTEVAFKPAELAAAQLDPNIFPTPDTTVSPAGPSWIQIGSEGGFLPAPVIVPNQPITWIIDPTRFDVGNVDLHSMLVAPAERADVIVDFSQFAGKTLILYNDAPAAFPARVASYDYYTGAPDLSPVGAPTILPGYGPNTRTVMQVKIAGTPAAPFNFNKLRAAFLHKADGSGVFESGQHPIIVGQAAYNSAYGTNFVANSYCNGGSTSTLCDGFARISDQGKDLFGFNTLMHPDQKLEIPLEPKAIHDEMNAAAFDEFGRMTANIGLEAVPATPNGQNIVLTPFVNPPTELIDATNLPKNQIGIEMTPIATADGTQIWKITHNGVDTHPLHFHLYDVQVLNRVTWDNIIIPPDPNELGWKDTVRTSPLEDTYVALRPLIPALPWELPNSIRPLHPMTVFGSTIGFNNVDASGNPTNPITNQLVNFGWEYVWHCHILAHEEMDMMRPQVVAVPPLTPDGLTYRLNAKQNTVVLTWNDNSITETAFVVQKDDGSGFATIGTVDSPLALTNTHGTKTFRDPTGYDPTKAYRYQVVAQNTVGYGGQFMSLTAESTSTPLIIGDPPLAPTNLRTFLQDGPQIKLVWMDNATNETGFIIERSINGGAFVQIATQTAKNGTGNKSFVDTTVTAGNNYSYRVAATNPAGLSVYSNTADINLNMPTILSAVAVLQPDNINVIVTLTWTDVVGETRYRIQWSDNNFTSVTGSSPVAANVTTFTSNALLNQNWQFRVGANTATGWVVSAPVNVNAVPVP